MWKIQTLKYINFLKEQRTYLGDYKYYKIDKDMFEIELYL